MCVGFNCKNNYFPISILTKILLHDKDQQTIKECQHYSIPVIDDKAELLKSKFNYEIDEVNYFKFLYNIFYLFISMYIIVVYYVLNLQILLFIYFYFCSKSTFLSNRKILMYKYIF